MMDEVYNIVDFETSTWTCKYDIIWNYQGAESLR